MLDRSFVGHRFPSFSADVEAGRLKFFAKAIGETNPIYTDEVAAKEAGYRSLPAPPTFPFTLDMEGPEMLPVLRLLELDIGRVLHGNQAFEYFAPICAGDRITVTSGIADMFDKKGGALEFIVMESNYTNQNGERVASARNTVVYRN